MAKITNPCGCTADSQKWLHLCAEHKQFHDNCNRSSDLQAISQLIAYYEQYPTDDNLGHVVLRIKKHGSIVSQDEAIAAWIIKRRSDLQRISTALAGNWKPK